jgi:predicted membrane-bound spermidine synthase
MAWFFVFFFASGFCSILYELIWLRLAMAQFGVTSAFVAIALSTFMAGLGLGSWWSGRLIGKYRDRIHFPALRLYALAELLIGVSALVVPLELRLGRHVLERFTLASSASYYLVSGAWIAVVLIPACGCMGATIPVAMLAVRQRKGENRRSFSFLYLANVTGAVTGAILPLLLIELYGFRGTLKIGAALNALIAVTAMLLTLGRSSAPLPPSESPAFVAPVSKPDGRLMALLFATGLTSMGVEVVWIRQFTPFLGTLVYAFAAILAVYLAATFVGSQVYRFSSRQQDLTGAWIWGILGLAVLLPLAGADPHFDLSRMQRLLLGVVPLSGVLGFVTPMLVDRWSHGRAEQAGPAYAVNIAGCILGPLLSGFLLMPYMSERWVLFLYALPWMAVASYMGPLNDNDRTAAYGMRQRAIGYALAVLALLVVFKSRSFEDRFLNAKIVRDSTATIIATGDGMDKRLLVNGVGITELTPITKIMAHMPLAYLDHPPQNALVICLGMGTTYRSMLSWGIPTTVVELVPSVPRVFAFYNPTHTELLQSPLSHVVVDDGRRYLERTAEPYDVITLDPPPPVEAAGSSLLYSREFYETAREHLRPGGILQQWLPFGDAMVQAAVARAIQESFPYVRVFHSLNGWGYHFLASDQPIPKRTPQELAQRLPEAAAKDLVEWGPEHDAAHQFADVLKTELPIVQVVAGDRRAVALQDDHPVNEYYAIRRKWLNPHRWYLVW